MLVERAGPNRAGTEWITRLRRKLTGAGGARTRVGKRAAAGAVRKPSRRRGN